MDRAVRSQVSKKCEENGDNDAKVAINEQFQLGELQRILLKLQLDMFQTVQLIYTIHEQTPTNLISTKINEIVDDLSLISSVKEKVTLSIPMDIIQYIESGRNPDVYTRQFSELSQKDNQYLNGKVLAYYSFGQILAQELSKEFPDLKEQLDTTASPPS